MRAQSHWGWGWADKFPDAAGRETLATQIGAVLGMPTQAPRDPIPLAEVQVPRSKVPVPEALAAWTTADPEARIRRTYGRAFLDQLRGFRGDFSPAPDLVATPADEEGVRATLAFARAEGLTVVPYGGGTSVVGGVEPAAHERGAGVICLDMGRMDRLLAVDAESGLAHLEAGVRGPALEAALSPHGLTLRHFPQSFEFSTLGGWIATRAGGHFATVYTHIDDLTAGIRMITGAGEIWESRPLPGSGAGPSPDRLVLGSEGTLGVITSAWMRVRGRPQHRASAGVHFAEFSAAVAAARVVARSGLFPSNCRLLDAREAALNMVAVDGSSVLLLGFEALDRSVRPQMEQALALVTALGGRLPRPATFREGAPARDAAAQSWRDAFLEAPYLQSRLLSLGLMADTFETACTWSAFPGLHQALVTNVRGAMKSFGVRGRLTCRFTHVYPDGPAPYYTFITPMVDDVEAQWRAIKAVASETLLAHGATITHHHAVGRTHRPWYETQRPAPFGPALRAMKQVVDPAGVLNPGVLLAIEGG